MCDSSDSGAHAVRHDAAAAVVEATSAASPTRAEPGLPEVGNKRSRTRSDVSESVGAAGLGESRAVAPAGVGVVISFAHPDYKRPYIASDHLTCKSPADAVVQVERRVQQWLEDRFDSEYLASRGIDTYSKLSDFAYSEYYMDNPLIDAMMFADGKWGALDVDFDALVASFAKGSSKSA